MSAVWTATSYAGTNWQTIGGFLDYFGKALWKRQRAVVATTGFATNAAYVSPFSVGKNLQHDTFNIQVGFAFTANCNVIGAIQEGLDACFGIGNGFVIPTVDPTALTATDLASFATNPANFWTGSGTAANNIFIAAGYSEGGWRRKHRRRVNGTNIAHSLDVDGNAWTAGQVAEVTCGTNTVYNLNNGTNSITGPNGSNSTVIGIYDGANWTRLPDVGYLADIVASDQAAPGSCAAGVTGLEDLMEGPGWSPWGQIRDVANLMTLTVGTASVNSSTYYYGTDQFGTNNSNATFADAQALANGNFSANAAPFIMNIGQATWGRYYPPFAPEGYFALVVTGSQTYKLSPPNHVQRTARFYCGIVKANITLDGAVNQFDAQTSGYTEGQVVGWASVGPSALATLTSGQLLDPSVLPPNWPPDPQIAGGGADYSDAAGWAPNGQLVLVDWVFDD